MVLFTEGGGGGGGGGHSQGNGVGGDGNSGVVTIRYKSRNIMSMFLYHSQHLQIYIHHYKHHPTLQSMIMME